MKIRKCANLLLGAAVPFPVSAPPGFELPPPSPRFELPPPAQAGFASKTSSSAPEPCAEIFSPWDLMSQLDLSDPQQEEAFMETYSVPVIRRASWLLPASMSAGSIKEDDENMVNVVNDEGKEDMAVDMVNESILEPCLPKDDAGRKTAAKKNESKPKTKKGKEKAEESDDSSVEEVWTCKKNDGKRWFCRRLVSKPDSFCAYHSDPKLPGGSKPRKKRTPAFGYAVGDGFYYYAGFGPSRTTKRHRASTSSVPEAPPAEERVVAQLTEEHAGFTTVQVQADGEDHQVVPSARVDDEADMAGIAGCDESSSDDGSNGEPAGDITGKSTMKKRWRKPVKSRCINSLM